MRERGDECGRVRTRCVRDGGGVRLPNLLRRQDERDQGRYERPNTDRADDDWTLDGIPGSRRQPSRT